MPKLLSRLIFQVVCVGAVLGMTLGAVSAGAGAEKPASLSLKDLQGAKVKISDYRGKIVVLNLWATWCGPCNAEMPMLVKTAATYAGKNVAFIGASVDAPETQGKVSGYAERLKITYPIWVGATDVDMKRLQVGEAVPATMFLDADGIIRARILGQMQPGEIEQRVDWLLGGQQGTAPASVVKHLDEK